MNYHSRHVFTIFIFRVYDVSKADDSIAGRTFVTQAYRPQTQSHKLAAQGEDVQI